MSCLFRPFSGAELWPYTLGCNTVTYNDMIAYDSTWLHMMTAISPTDLCLMATHDYVCSHMVTYGFSDFKLLMFTYGGIWHVNSYGPLHQAHAMEPYATICDLAGRSPAAACFLRHMSYVSAALSSVENLTWKWQG